MKLQLQGVSLDYQEGENVFRALENVSFSVKEGEFVSIIGSSGCGKSTLLSILSGLRNPTTGKFLIDGEESSGTGKNRGIVFQHYSLFPWMTSKKNVSFGIQQSQLQLEKKQAEELAITYLQKVGLEEVKDKYPYQLSGGMRQRIAIARVLAMKPEILLMDEPFGAVDAKNRMILQDLLLQLLSEEEQKKTIVFVTHDIEEAILLSDRVLFMKDKRIQEEVTIALSRPRIREEVYQSEEYRRVRQKIMRLFYQKVKENIGEYEVVI